MQLTITHLEASLAQCEAEGNSYRYVETGKYKPYSVSTVAAAKRRGYKVEKQCDGVYYVYPKAVQKG